MTRSCGPAPSVANGIVVSRTFQGSQSTTGSKVLYRCVENYFISSGVRDFSVCLRDGSWSQPPQCYARTQLQQSQGCGPRPNVTNGVIAYSNILPQDINNCPAGSLAVYQCFDGYHFRKTRCGDFVNNVIQCGDDGTWTEPPECTQDRVCLSLPSIANGRIERRTFYGQTASYGDVVKFACLSGFELKDRRNEMSQCLEDGTWSQLPQCQPATRKCLSQVNVPNSRIIFKDEAQTTVVIECQPGYALVGSQTITCQPDGRWSTLPTCQSMSQTGVCPRVPTVYNSQISSQRFANSAAPSPGDYAVFQCNRGFYSNSPNNLVVCLADGRWSETPVCHNNTGSCGPVPQVQNARVSYSTVSGSASKGNDVVWYECSMANFELVGSNAIRCIGQDWTAVPLCRPKPSDRCGNLPSLRNGQLISPIFDDQIGAQVSFRCYSNFQLVGSPTVTCQTGGQWSQSPTCEPLQRMFHQFCI